MTDANNKHIFTEQLIRPVAASAGVPQVTARRVIKAFLQQINNELSLGHDLTLERVGRLRVSTVNSYWKYGLGQEKKVQKKYRRIYYKASQSIMKQLNQNLRDNRHIKRASDNCHEH